MQRLDVSFASGRELLNAYWGYLSGGGLTIRADRVSCRATARDDPGGPFRGLCKGEPVSVQIRVGPRRAFTVRGTVARVTSDGAVVAFDGHDSQNRLLAAALSERATDMTARLSPIDRARGPVATAHVFELSEDGCCVRLQPEYGGSFAVGTEVVMEADGFRINGCVISGVEHERCIIFGLGDEQAIQAVRAHL